MTDPSASTERLSLFGQPLFGKDALLPRFRAARGIDDLVPLLELEDNYVAVYESGRDVFIVSSLYSLSPYFYSLDPAREPAFLHGDTLYELARKGALDLAWNCEAIADQMALEHLVGDDTLVRGARPVPQGAILHFDGARLTERRFRFDAFSHPPRPSEAPDRLVELFLEGIRAGVGERPVLTGSSGLDSRVNLAALLHLGHRPEVCVMGVPESKDVQVVMAMAKAFNLRVNHVELEPRDYVDCAFATCRATNGVKPFAHWHSYLLGQKSGYRRDDHVITGNNGEHVRAAGFDAGILSLALDALSLYGGRKLTDHAQSRVLKKRTTLLLRDDELARCAPELARYYGTPLQNAKLMSVIHPDLSFVWQADAFVLDQRRRGFQACGLKLYSLGFFPFSAFMRKSWVDAGWQLTLPWRVGSRWHRYAVERLCPRLMDFPEEREAQRMRRRERPLRWMPPFRTLYKGRNVAYVDPDAILRRPEILALLRDHASELEGFMPRSLVLEIADEHEKKGGRGRLCGTLIAMAIWRASLRGGPSKESP